MTGQAIGFLGLGNMGRVLAGNLAATGARVIAYDPAGTAERLPDGAVAAASVAEVLETTTALVFSLPGPAALEAVVADIVACRARTVRDVLDTSTVGPAAARAAADELDRCGVAYCDAPVSGGVAAARARRITVMFAGPEPAWRRLEPVVRGLSDSVTRVGQSEGLGQAMKLANNFLSATALLATSEAVAFGESVGLDPKVMMEVFNVSSGMNSATRDKFPNQVLPGTFDAGFANSLMSKDTALYLAAATAHGTPNTVAGLTASTWERFAAAEPGADFTRIYPFVAHSPGSCS